MEGATQRACLLESCPLLSAVTAAPGEERGKRRGGERGPVVLEAGERGKCSRGEDGPASFGGRALAPLLACSSAPAARRPLPAAVKPLRRLAQFRARGRRSSVLIPRISLSAVRIGLFGCRCEKEVAQLLRATDEADAGGGYRGAAGGQDLSSGVQLVEHHLRVDGLDRMGESSHRFVWFCTQSPAEKKRNSRPVTLERWGRIWQRSAPGLPALRHSLQCVLSLGNASPFRRRPLTFYLGIDVVHIIACHPEHRPTRSRQSAGGRKMSRESSISCELPAAALPGPMLLSLCI